ncbi:DUF2946 family protein [Rugamonas sp. CCM 8940]|uniref:DUF2946 family protein n=1 Tax=Rugamonas sp. CCM 8940 TaxID=2765359 RepID=UPI0018F662D9|nr:DUF2946 family protein [Rugamonas sp. CCM 8940]MBJ7313375.1 DUF2946 family protein [Rugamonas sp. CCM 8940]
MDEIVKQAIAKWPNVPHCYGWLGLDARGQWRMRDERAQQLDLPGDKLQHVALLAFIARNYDRDERGCWYFQNGPQRVYLNLEATPYIARSVPGEGWQLHTGVAMGPLDAVYLSQAGALFLHSGTVLAQLDDRDFAQVLPLLWMDGASVSDEALMAWLEDGKGALSLHLREAETPVTRLAQDDDVAARFGFVRRPAP